MNIVTRKKCFYVSLEMIIQFFLKTLKFFWEIVLKNQIEKRKLQCRKKGLTFMNEFFYVELFDNKKKSIKGEIVNNSKSLTFNLKIFFHKINPMMNCFEYIVHILSTE